MRQAKVSDPLRGLCLVSHCIRRLWITVTSKMWRRLPLSIVCTQAS